MSNFWGAHQNRLLAQRNRPPAPHNGDYRAPAWRKSQAERTRSSVQQEIDDDRPVVRRVPEGGFCLEGHRPDNQKTTGGSPAEGSEARLRDRDFPWGWG